jgi:DHA3 family macrolide efflux protein-like MFS transporter
MDLRSTFQGMRSFLLIWFGQLVSGLGSGLTGFGLGVYLYTTTGSTTQFALNSLFYVLPMGLVQLFTGALADRWNRRRMLILADSGQAVLALLLALLLTLGTLLPWHIYLITALNSVLRAFQGPAYAASIALLVPKHQLARAAGLGQINEAITHLITPLLAGLLVISIGLPNIIWIDLGTFLVAITTLLAVRIPDPPPSSQGPPKRSLGQDIVFGWRYLWDRPGLLAISAISFAHDLFLNMVLVLTVPMVLSFADADAVGMVVTAGGAGMLLGGALVSAHGELRNPITFFLGAIAWNGLALILMGGASTIITIALGRLLLFVGFAFYIGSMRPLFQRKVALDVQGRVFGAIGALAMLTEAPAYPVGGFLADRVFEPLIAGGGWLTALSSTGPGRGMGALHCFAGLCILAIALVGSRYSRIRQLEDEVPDVIGLAAECEPPASRG